MASVELGFVASFSLFWLAILFLHNWEIPTRANRN